MADPKVNFVQKTADAKGGAKINAKAIAKKFKLTLPMMVSIFSTLFFFGIGGMSMKVIWGYQHQQLEVIKAQKEAKRKEFEKKDLEYSMEPLEVNFPGNEEGLRQLQVEISFQLQSEYARKEFSKKEDQIRDDILMLLSGKKEEELRDIESRKKIQDEIVARVNKFMSSKAQVKEVFFPSFFIE